MTLIVGMGNTGLSVARYLARRGEPFAFADSRPEPPGMEALRKQYPRAEIYPGPFATEIMQRFRRLILSPGVSPHEPALVMAREAGVDVMGDIELFFRSVDAPVAGITGSNGKSTVTTLLGKMAGAAGLEVRVGGNLGTPALDLLLESDAAGAPDLYVLELSSFQLETVQSLACHVAAVLNIAEDHLDRHGSMGAYIACKSRILENARVRILNRDDPVVAGMSGHAGDVCWFSTHHPDGKNQYGLIHKAGEAFLARGSESVMAVAELKMAGRHNLANALAAIALADAVAIPHSAIVRILQEFPGLPHRCQWLASIGGVNWYDDSKGTNVGATAAALGGMPSEKVVLIAGGDGKGQDFTPLRDPVCRHARAVVLIGRDAERIAQAVAGSVPVIHSGSSLEQAVMESARLARPGDCVLFSPACASFDMFDDYMHRAAVFAAAVQRLAA